MKAWHLTGPKLRDGRPIPAISETLVHDGRVEICRTGLHASERLLDALQYAPEGATLLHRVECDLIADRHDDKIVCRRRTILATYPLRIERLRVLAGECAAVACWAAGLDGEVYQLAAAATTAYRLGEAGRGALEERWVAAGDAAGDSARDAAGDAAGAASAAASAASAAARDASAAAWDSARDVFESRAIALLTVEDER